MLSASFTSSEARSCSAQETPLQHAVWYPACCRAQRTGAAWSSFGCASTMIFMALSRAGDWERQHAAGAPLVLFQGSVSLFTSGYGILLIRVLIRTAGGAGQHESEWRNLSSRDLCDFLGIQPACALTGEHPIVFIRHKFLSFRFQVLLQKPGQTGPDGRLAVC